MDIDQDPLLTPAAPQRTAREKRDQRRAARAQEHGQERIWTLGKWGIIVVVGALVVVGAARLIKQQQPQGPDYSQAYAIQGRSHIAVGAEHEPYNSNPPTSGPHYAEPAREGTYKEVLTDEQVIHNLEHGDIWISYKPSIPEEVKKQLEAFADSWDKVVIGPREKNGSDIALASWGRLDTFNLENGTFDHERITNFIKRYQWTGPERVPATTHIRQ